MDDCLFCKIARGEIPSKTIYEDELIKVFYDIDPKAPVHFLLIPKEHVASSVNDLNPGNSAVVAHVYEVAAKLAGQFKLEGGYRVVCNCGPDAGQTVHHLHFHVLGGKDLGPMCG